MPSTAAESKRRRYQLDINMRRRIPLARGMLRVLLFIDGGSTTPTELAQLLQMDRRVVYVYARRLARLGLLASEIITDSESRTGRSAVYHLTGEGCLLAAAWEHFLKKIGATLVKRLRLED